MHGIHELRNRLLKELESYGTKDLSTGSLDTIDKLAHTVKNIDRIMSERNGGRDSQREMVAARLRDLMVDVADDQMRSEIHALVDKIEM